MRARVVGLAGLGTFFPRDPSSRLPGEWPWHWSPSPPRAPSPPPVVLPWPSTSGPTSGAGIWPALLRPLIQTPCAWLLLGAVAGTLLVRGALGLLLGLVAGAVGHAAWWRSQEPPAGAGVAPRKGSAGAPDDDWAHPHQGLGCSGCPGRTRGCPGGCAAGLLGIGERGGRRPHRFPSGGGSADE